MIADDNYVLPLEFKDEVGIFFYLGGGGGVGYF